MPNTPAWSTLTEAEQKAVYADYEALNKTEGVTPGLPLGFPDNAKTVRVQAGAVVASDGPYSGKEAAAGGYLVLDAPDMEAVIEIAARIPAARHGGGIEIRPVATYW